MHRDSKTKLAQIVFDTFCAGFVKPHVTVHSRLTLTPGLGAPSAVLQVLQTFIWMDMDILYYIS